MSSIDERIVEMKFKAGEFEDGIKDALSALGKLKDGLKLDGAKSGLDSVSDAAKNIDLSGLAANVEKVASRFSIMGVVGATVIASITKGFMSVGGSILGAITGPLVEGGKKRALSIEQAKFQFKGLGMDVDKSMTSALNAVRGTAYGLDEAATVAANFGASGMKAGDGMTKSLRAIAGVAAMTGSSYADIGDIFTKVAGQNRFMGDDINRLSSRGVNAAAILAKEFGKTEAEVRKMAGKSQISFKQFSDAMDKAFGAHATKASETYAGALANMNAAMSRIGAQFYTYKYEALRNIFNALTPAIDAVAQALGPVIDMVGKRMVDSAKKFGAAMGKLNIKKLLDSKEFEKIGKPLAAAFKNILDMVSGILGPIKAAFKDIFPPTSIASVANMAKSFAEFTKTLVPSKETGEKIRDIFKGVFSVFAIGWEIIKGGISLIGTLIQTITGGTGGFLSIAAAAGAFVSKLREWIITSGSIKAFFAILTGAGQNIIRPLVAFVSELVSAFVTLFRGDTGGFFDKLKSSFSALNPLIDFFKGGIDGIKAKFAEFVAQIPTFFTQGVGKVKEIWAGLLEFLSGFVNNLLGYLKGLGSSVLNPIISLIETIARKLEEFKTKTKLEITAKTDGLKNAAGEISKFVALNERAKKVAENVKAVWDALVNAFTNVGGAIGPMAGAINDLFKTIIERVTAYVKTLDMQDALAVVNTGFFIALYKMAKDFFGSLKTLTDNLGEFVGSIKDIGQGIIDSIGQLTSTLKTMQQDIKANIILKIAIAISLLAASLWVLAGINIADLSKALGAITVLFAELMGTMKVFSMMTIVDGGKLTSAALALGLVALAVLLLASAVKKIADLSWNDMIKGLVGVGAILAGLSLFTKFAQANEVGIKGSAGLILLAIAINLLAIAVTKIGKEDTGTLIKGIVSLGVMLAMLSGMVKALNNTSGVLTAAAGLLVLSVALVALYIPLRLYATLNWQTLVWGLTTMAATLGVLAAAMRLMPSNMAATAGSLVIVAAALVILGLALKMMGGMSVEQIAKSLLVLVVSLTAIAAAMMFMTEALPGAAALLVVSAALTVLAFALVLLGNLSLETIGTALLAIAGTFIVLGLAAVILAPVVPVLMALAGVIMALGQAALVAGAGMMLFALAFGVLAAVGTAGVAVLLAAFSGILQLIPLFLQQVGLGMIALAKVLTDAAPVLLKAFVAILTSLLNAIIQVTPKAVQAFLVLLTGLLRAVVQALPKIAAAMLAILDALLRVIVGAVPRIVSAGMTLIIGFLNGVASKIGAVVAAAANLIIQFLNGLAKQIPNIANSAVKLISTFIREIGSAAVRIARSGLLMILDFINGLTAAVNQYAPRIRTAGLGLATAIVDGMTGGLASAVGRIADKARALASAALDTIKSILRIGSPSKETHKLGAWAGEGLALGIESYAGGVKKAGELVGHSAIDSMRKSLTGLADVIDADIDLNPVIAPVLDLSDIKKNAGQISGLLGAAPLSVDANYASAVNASKGYRDNQTSVGTDTAPVTPSTPVTFNQYNNSPKELSSAEIYRQTKNQLSIAKGALTV